MNYFGNINDDLLARIPLNSQFILEVGCGEGALAREFLRLNPLTCYVGVEINKLAGEKATHGLTHVVIGNIECEKTITEIADLVSPNKFDVLIFGDVLEHLYDPWLLLTLLHPLLSHSGICISCLPNVSHWSILSQQLAGTWKYEASGLLDFTHIRFFTLETTLGMLAKSGYKPYKAIPRVLWPQQTDEAIEKFENLAQVFNIPKRQFKSNLSAYQWIVLSGYSEIPETLTIAALGLPEIGGVTKARIDYPLQALSTIPGVDVLYRDDVSSFLLHDEPGVFVFHRQFIDTPQSQAFLEQLVRKGWVVISEIDDDPCYWQEYVDSDFYAFRAVHGVTCSTETLANKLSKWNENVYVFDNAILKLPNVSGNTPKNLNSLKIFFGAINREDDWRSIKNSLYQAFKVLKNKIEIVVVHDRSVYDDIPRFCAKTYYDTLPHDIYMQKLGECDIALLPLNDTSFNRNKSDLKFIECCAAETVPICSRVVYGDVDVHKAIGIFPETDQEWGPSLISLCHDFDAIKKRKKIGREYVQSKRMYHSQIIERARTYQTLVASKHVLEQQRQKRLRKCNK